MFVARRCPNEMDKFSKEFGYSNYIQLCQHLRNCFGPYRHQNIRRSLVHGKFMWHSKNSGAGKKSSSNVGEGDAMRKAILIMFVSTILLTGCKGANEVLYSIANDKRVKTKIIQDKHNQAMGDSRALTQKRLEFKNTAYNVAMISVVVLGIWFNIAGVYWLIGSVHIGLQKKQFMVIDDPQQLRFPVLVRGDNVADISTGRGFLITDRAPPNRMLAENSTMVQLVIGAGDKHTPGRSEIIEIG